MTQTAPAAVENDAHVSARELAREALESCGGNSHDAIEALGGRILADRALLEQFLPAIVIRWASHCITSLSKESRDLLSETHSNVAAIDGSIFREAARANTLRLMDFPIWGGMPISHATAAEIRASVEQHNRAADTHARRARWQSAVADELTLNGTSEETVSACLTEATLIRLWEETANAE